MNLELRVCRYSRFFERLVWYFWFGYMIRGMKVGDWIYDVRKEIKKKLEGNEFFRISYLNFIFFLILIGIKNIE